MDRVAELSAGELVPETLDGGKVGGRDVLDLSPVNEVTSLLLGTSKNNQCITGELRIKTETNIKILSERYFYAKVEWIGIHAILIHVANWATENTCTFD